MAKITLDDVGSGYQTATKQNANNDSIETHLNDKVLYRDNPTGEANTMQQELDMNSNLIRNLTNPNAAQDAATKDYTDSLLSGTTDTGSAQLRVDLADTANGEGASLVGIEDSAGDFTATTVEGALAELESEKVALTGNETIAGDKTFSGTVKQTKGSDVASATALPLGDGNYFDVTGTVAITSINTKGVGTIVRVHFDAILTLTHHATDLILPGGANITTAAGDEAEFIEYATGDWRCTSYTKASGAPLSTTSFRGALVGTSVVQSLLNNTGTILLFNSEEYDTDSIHDLGSNTERLTVPSGVTKVRISCGGQFDANATGIRTMGLGLNGGAITTGTTDMVANAVPATHQTNMVIHSAVLSVVATDYFTVSVLQNSGSTDDIRQFWFAMEIIE